MLVHMPRVAIIGGSIGGLTAALVLRDLGCDVQVFERSTNKLEARGAGIGLHPVTTRYFRERTTMPLDQVAIELPWLKFVNATGEDIYAERMNYRFSSWNTIYRNLLASFEKERYHLNSDVLDFEQDDLGVSIFLANGSRHRVDLLVCADGIRSRSRQKLLPHAQAKYAGYVAWRATLLESQLKTKHFEQLKEAITYCLLPAGHVLVYPIPSLNGELAPGTRLSNLVWYHNYDQRALDDLMTDTEGQRQSLSLAPGHVRDCHISWARQYASDHMAPALAQVMTDTKTPFIQVIYDIAIDKMAFGRIVLIGDAAFAVRPHAAAGTAKACADGWGLSEALQSCNGDIKPALAEWESNQIALGRQLLDRTRLMGDRSQFKHDWLPGDPTLKLGLYGPGR